MESDVSCSVVWTPLYWYTKQVLTLLMVSIVDTLDIFRWRNISLYIIFWWHFTLRYIIAAEVTGFPMRDSGNLQQGPPKAFIQSVVFSSVHQWPIHTSNASSNTDRLSHWSTFYKEFFIGLSHYQHKFKGISESPIGVSEARKENPESSEATQALSISWNPATILCRRACLQPHQVIKLTRRYFVRGRTSFLKEFSSPGR